MIFELSFFMVIYFDRVCFGDILSAKIVQYVSIVVIEIVELSLSIRPMPLNDFTLKILSITSNYPRIFMKTPDTPKTF